MKRVKDNTLGVIAVSVGAGILICVFFPMGVVAVAEGVLLLAAGVKLMKCR